MHSKVALGLQQLLGCLLLSKLDGGQELDNAKRHGARSQSHTPAAHSGPKCGLIAGCIDLPSTCTGDPMTSWNANATGTANSDARRTLPAAAWAMVSPRTEGRRGAEARRCCIVAVTVPRGKCGEIGVLVESF